MTIPCHLFEGTRADAAHGYAAIFGPPAPRPLRAGGQPHPRHGVLFAMIQTRNGWRSVPNLSQAEPEEGSTLAVTMSDAAEGQRVFDALAEGGEVETPYQPTFWSPGFGRLTDRWGTHWVLDTMPPPRGGA